MMGMGDFCLSCRKESTSVQYRGAISLFLESVYGLKRVRRRTPEQLIDLESKSIVYLSEERDYVSDLIRFVASMKGMSPLTQGSHLNIVVFWLEMNDITIPKSKMKFLRNRVPVKTILTQDKPLTMNMIRTWHEHLSHVGRVILMIMLSSGMRINEVCSITLDDIDLTQSPAVITIRPEYAKNGTERYTFLSSEAAFAVSEWLKVRDAYLEKAVNQTRSVEKSLNDDRLIPIERQMATEALTNGLKKADMYTRDKRTGRGVITSHSLRKFFMSQMKKGMPIEHVEMIAGHGRYLSDSYRRYDIEEVKVAYLQAEYLICMSNADLDPIRDRMCIVDQENQILSSKLERADIMLKALEGICKNYDLDPL